MTIGARGAGPIGISDSPVAASVVTGRSRYAVMALTLGAGCAGVGSGNAETVVAGEAHGVGPVVAVVVGQRVAARASADALPGVGTGSAII